MKRGTESPPPDVDVRPDSPGCLAVYRESSMIGWMHDQPDGQWIAFSRYGDAPTGQGRRLGTFDRDTAIARIAEARW